MNSYGFQAKLQSNGFCEGFSVKEVTNKMKKLCQKYKAEKDKTRRSGSNRGKQWKFFQNIDAFFCRKHNIEPPVIIDTMSERESAISVPSKWKLQKVLFFSYALFALKLKHI